MATSLQLYAKLIPVLNGEMLTEQCALSIEDRVNEPTRIKIESALPESGPEFDARARIGQRVTLAVHVFDFHKQCPGALVFEASGPIVSAITSATTIAQSNNSITTQTFVVEHQPE